MFRRLFALSLSVIAMHDASAAVVAFTLPDSPIPTYAATSTAEYTLGYTFTVGADEIRITDLGFFDHANNGLGSSHQVTIWDNNGAVVGSATVPGGTAGTLEANYRYSAVTAPFVLSANTTYTIGATMYTNLDFSPSSLSTGAITAAPGVTLGSARSLGSAGYPTGDPTFNGQYLTANFQYEVVPEPGTYLMVGIGLASIGFFRRQRR